MSANILRTIPTPETNPSPECPPPLRGERVLLRPPAAGDVEPLAAILAERAVSRWWGERDAGWVRRELVQGEPGWVIVVDDAVVGWLQYSEETDPEYRHVGLDIFLTTALHGGGVAREALRLAIHHFIEQGHHRFTIDPAADNERAIRAYAALGFKPVGVMRRYERGADGKWHDGLLMDLLADEFLAR
jgi:aminoglycoside 6'-N-acetyltransferase